MSELEELAKLPEESMLFDMDFAKRMSTGESIAGVSSSTTTSSSRVSGSSNITLGTPSYNGNIVQLRVSGGTQNEIYTVAITVTTSLGNTKVGKGALRIE